MSLGEVIRGAPPLIVAIHVRHESVWESREDLTEGDELFFWHFESPKLDGWDEQSIETLIFVQRNEQILDCEISIVLLPNNVSFVLEIREMVQVGDLRLNLTANQFMIML